MTIRFAVLGCGRIGKMHAEILARRVAGSAVTVVFDVVADAADAVADQLGCDVAASLADAVSRDDVDAVAICTSTDTHVDAMVAAAAAGKAVFCEKPISLSLAEVDRGLADGWRTAADRVQSSLRPEPQGGRRCRQARCDR